MDAKRDKNQGNSHNLETLTILYIKRNDPRKPKPYTTQHEMPKGDETNEIKILHDTNAKIQNEIKETLVIFTYRKKGWGNTHLECGVISIGGGGEDEEGDGVSEGAPSEDIHECETGGVAGLEETRGFGCPREARLLHLRPLGGEEHESAQEEQCPIAESYN